jgi:hypothetical protein
MTENQDKTPTAEAEQDAAQASNVPAEASATAQLSEELSDDLLEAVTGGLDATAGRGHHHK